MDFKILAVISLGLACFSLGLSIGRLMTKERTTVSESEPTAVTASVDTLSEWQTLTLAIALTESKCNPNAVGSANDGGLLQIRPIYVSEVNRVSGTSYTHEDVYTPASAIDMFNRMQMYYNPEKDISKAIYYHNKSKDYKTKVIRSMELVKRYEDCRKVVVSYGK